VQIKLLLLLYNIEDISSITEVGTLFKYFQ